jgi:hypothetical protein
VVAGRGGSDGWSCGGLDMSDRRTLVVYHWSSTVEKGEPGALCVRVQRFAVIGRGVCWLERSPEVSASSRVFTVTLQSLLMR